jgi:phage tail-like protein
MRRFLLIFEAILGPIEGTIDNIARYLDPRLTPPELLPWLASWVGLELDENWPIAQQRQLVLWAATLYRWRGTRRGLREHLRLYTGRTPLIVENFPGLRVGQDAALGTNTRLGESARPHWISVTVLTDRPDDVDERIVRQIIELEKPAHVGYTLEIREVER